MNGADEHAPSERSHVLAGELIRVLTAIRGTFADEVATAALWPELGQHETARMLAAEIDHIERSVIAMTDTDTGWHLVHELTNVAVLDAALDAHDPLRRLGMQ